MSRDRTISHSVTVNGRTYTIDEMYAPQEANLGGIANGPGGRVWFTASDAEYVGASNAAGRMTAYPFSPSLLTNFIVEGPDGNMWLPGVAESKSALGRMTPTGGTQLFPIPKKFGEPVESPIVTSGGYLWFLSTVSADAYLVRSKTDGTMNGLKLPFGSQPVSLAVSNDGSFWFTDDKANAVERMSAKGNVTTFQIPTSGAGPFGICQGPGDTMWFLEYSANKVANVTAGGTFHEYPIPTPYSRSTFCVTGPDGAVWFSESAGKIGRVTASGGIVELPLSAPSADPYVLIAGGDGNVWFTESQAAGIVGRVELHDVKNSKPEYSSFTLTLGKEPLLGMSQKIQLTVQVRDLSGQVITGNYPTPVYLKTTDGKNAKLNTAVLHSSSEKAQVAYSGQYADATISASADGGGTSHSATLIPSAPPEKRLPAPAVNMTIGSHNSLWMCLRDGSIATRSATGTIRDFKGADYYFSSCSMVEGPDHNVWFTDYDNDRIAGITPSGKVRYIALGQGASPSSITTGPDGALWVTEFLPKAIARVELDGKVTTFTPKASPSVIVTGTDGNLWFLDFGGKIYKMTTAGVATLVKKHVQNSYLWSFNGGLWYVVPGYPAYIEEMSTDGKTIERYAEPFQCAPNALTGSPDGTLWYVDDFRSCVVRIGTDGKTAVVPTYSQKEGQGYAGIAIGPSNDLWFTESGDSGLGWLNPKAF